MSAPARAMGQSLGDHPLRLAFLGWQCRCRQIAMREAMGRPDDSIAPAVILPGAAGPMGRIVTVLNKAPAHAVTAELEFMAARTHDPAERRAEAVRFLSASYYQKPAEFSDILTATFPAQSTAAARMRRAGQVRLVFAAHAQRFDLACRVWRLVARNPLHRATRAHNRLFNPALPPDIAVLGLAPDWARSSAGPGV